MKKIILILLIALIGNIYGQSKVGTTAAPFLNIAVGPRAIAMGGAFVATSDDITSLYWNPAGSANLENNSAMFAYTKWFADISYNWAGASVNLGTMGTLGLSLMYLDYGKMEVTTLAEQDGTGEMFSAKDMALGLSYAAKLTDQFSIGGTVKYINQKIWNSSASSVGFDVGVLFLSDIYGLRIGATITNFGPDMQIDGKDLYVQHDIDPNIFGNNDQILAKLKTDEYQLPLTFRVGLAMDLFNNDTHKFTVGVDALHPSDNDESVNVGMEYGLYKNIFLRAGYKSLFLNNAEEGLTLGFGLSYDIAPGLNLFIDYAYQDFGILKNSQHFAVGLKY